MSTIEFHPGKPVKFAEPPPSTEPPTLAQYINISTFNLPERANPNELVVFKVVGTVVAPLPSGHVAAIAIRYVAGPAAKITVTVNGDDFDLDPGKGVRLIYPVINPPVGTTIAAGCWMRLSDAGKYTFRAETYYDGVSDTTWTPIEDTHQDKVIEIPAPAAPKAEEGEGLTETIKKLMETIMPLMMTMMMLMMMMSLMTSLMRAFKPGGG